MARGTGTAPDSTLGLQREGYLWLPPRRRARGAPARTPAGPVTLAGPVALALFYDEANVRRGDALPEQLTGTVFGRGSVHTLDGEPHLHRKAMFRTLLEPPEQVRALVPVVLRGWDTAAAEWSLHGRPVALFDEASRLLTRAVCEWAGIRLPESDVAPLAADLVAIVDGFAAGGSRLRLARRARRRREEWAVGLVQAVRAGALEPPHGSALQVVAGHQQADRQLLDPRVAAVELLNVLRPTVALCWFAAWSGLAMHQWPVDRTRLAAGDPEYTRAFVHELRRYYPFAPFAGGETVRELEVGGERIPAGTRVIADLYGHNHDATLFPDPYRFSPERFLGREPGPYEVVAHGGGDAATGHRCPAGRLSAGVLEAITARLAALPWHAPEQDLTITPGRIPARITSGFLLTLPR